MEQERFYGMWRRSQLLSSSLIMTTNSLYNVVFSLLPGLVISLLSFCRCRWIRKLVGFLFFLLSFGLGIGSDRSVGSQRKENSAYFLYWVRQRSSLDIATSSQQTVFVDEEGGLFAVFSFLLERSCFFVLPSWNCSFYLARFQDYG